MDGDFEGQTCGTCKHSIYHEFEEGKRLLQCRIGPPVPVVQLGVAMNVDFDPKTQRAVQKPNIMNKIQPVYPGVNSDDPGCHDYEESEHVFRPPNPLEGTQHDPNLVDPNRNSVVDHDDKIP